MKSNSITDERAISNLMVSYAYANDDANIKKLGELFKDASIKIGDIAASGREEIEALAGNLIEARSDGRSSTTHEITNIMIEIDEKGISARGNAYWTLYKTISAAPREAILSGRYEDYFIKQNNEWIFKERNASLLWMLDESMFK